MSSGTTADVRVTATVAADRAGTTIVNGATVSAPEVDLDQADNIASASLSVAPPVPPAPPIPPPPSVPPSECLANVLRLVDVVAGRTRTLLVGETAKANSAKR